MGVFQKKNWDIYRNDRGCFRKDNGIFIENDGDIHNGQQELIRGKYQKKKINFRRFGYGGFTVY